MKELIEVLNPNHLAMLIAFGIGGIIFAIFRGIVIKLGDKEIRIGK